MRVDGYAPIRDYAAIGDGRTVGLVSLDGSIDWLCFPDHDSPAVFGALLDPEGGGRFALAPDGRFDAERRYIPETNVLETTYTTADGVVRVTDLMTLENGGLVPWIEVVRKVEGLSGAVPMRWSLEPRFGFGKGETRIELRKDVPVASSDGDSLALVSWDAGRPEVTADRIAGSFRASGGSTALLALSGAHASPVHLQPRDGVELRIDGTVESWKRWVRGRHPYEGPWGDAVVRSILALKLLIHTPTGAITAAPTTSLPERLGGDKNYDYRFAWPRDSSFTLDALMRLGYHEQAHASFTWLLDALDGTHPRVQPIYRIHGPVLSAERELDLPGYRGSRPVREGNDAAEQLQLSGYGDLLTTTWLYVRSDNILDPATGTRLAEVVDLLGSIWQNEDSGIWELPNVAHYTQSKMGAWVTFDRALRLVQDGQLPDGHAAAWQSQADAIQAWVEANCWSEELGAYAMAPGSEKLDASLLLTARMEYGEPTSERNTRTREAIRRELARGPLLHRYSGMPEEEGAFVACSFWLVESLARARRFEEAHELMEEMLPLANDVGLFSEQMDPDTHEFLGNFPQGLSHLALVNAAALYQDSLERASGGGSEDH
jgi:GH15 family glucan-1,4-alpha-glucosidase